MLKLTMQLLIFGHKFNVELFQSCTLFTDIWTLLDAGAGACTFSFFWTPVTQISFWFVHVAMLVFAGISSKTVFESDNKASISAALSRHTDGIFKSCVGSVWSAPFKLSDISRCLFSLSLF